MPYDTPVAMPYVEKEITLEDYFRNLVSFKVPERDIQDTQVGGEHYRRTQIQPWDIFLDYKLDPWTANVVKYVLRFPFKNGKEDLEKAKHYIEYLINNYEDITNGYYKKD